MKLQRLIEQYIAYQQSLGTAFLTDAMILRLWLRRRSPGADADIRLGQVESFLGKTRPVTITWHTKFRRLRSFFQFAVSRGHLAVAPLPTTIPKRPPAFAPYIFSRKELCRLFGIIDTDQRKTCLEPATMHTLILLLYGGRLALARGRRSGLLRCGLERLRANHPQYKVRQDTLGSFRTAVESSLGSVRGPRTSSAVRGHLLHDADGHPSETRHAPAQLPNPM